MSLYEFRSFLLTELRKQKIRIDLIDEEIPLFVANHQIVLFFPDYEQDERQILVFLFELMIPFAETFVIAYAIQNKQGACIISCDYAGNAEEEYVVEEYDSEHGRISVSRRIDNRVTSIWPEELYMWHFRYPGSLTLTDEMKRCPLKFRECLEDCAWFDEQTDRCAVFRVGRN